MRDCYRIFSLLVGLAIFTTTLGQQSRAFEPPDQQYRTALELFSREQYGNAQAIFTELQSLDKDLYGDIVADATFYDAMCSAELSHNDAPQKISAFLQGFPEHPQSRMAYFYLGRMNFRDGRYRDAIDAFREVNPRHLTSANSSEYYFKTGYSYLKINQPENAKKYLARADGKNSPYTGEASFYMAYISYLEGDYQTALPEFEKVKDNRKYAKEVPYYLLQINYKLGNNDYILAEGPQLVERATYKMKPEAARIVGDALYRRGNYKEAAGYYELFYRSTRSSLSREEQYQLAYTLYQTEQFGDAIGHFQKAIGQNDSLSQHAYYYLGMSYLKTDEKKFATNAFLSSYKAGVDRDITTESLFNYARLSLETTTNTYNEAIGLLEDFIARNNTSPRVNEAYDLLVSLYLNSRNYKQALESIENIASKSDALQEAYQQIAYFRGIEVFNVNAFEDAITLFKISSSYNFKPEIRALSNFWTGEAFYRLENYWGAMKYYGLFIDDRAARQTDLWPTAQYNLGYTHFKRKDYSKAIRSFKDFLATDHGNTRQAAEAYLRIADAYFINKQYGNAITFYDKSLLLKQSSGDYALYQKASSEGARGNYDKKIDALKVIEKNFASSIYHDDALYEIATTYLILGNERQALVYLDKISSQHASSSFAIKALMRTGLIYYNNNEYQKAIRAFKNVVERYPGSPESKEALSSLRNVYVETGNVDAYYEYANDIPFADIGTNERDSVTYVLAEEFYLEGKCGQAIPAFDDYLQEFPQGLYNNNARFYKAECLYKDGKFEESLAGYLSVISRPTSDFTETALVRASGIYFEQGHYEDAMPLFEKLREVASYPENKAYANAGLMKCAFARGDYSSAIDAGNKLLTSDQVSSELINEIHITLARSYLAMDRKELALSEYKIVKGLVQNEWAAEAQYHIAKAEYDAGNLALAEEMVFELPEKFSAHDYWVARGFILLADIYVAQDNLFQARQTLQSIVDNYTGPDLGEIASEKLEEVKRMEAASEQPSNQGEE
jgi:TolA-binding protein